MSTKIAGRDPWTGQSIEINAINGKIAAIESGDEQDTAWLSPGLIDLQINGYGGSDLNAEGLTPETVIELTRKVVATGVTTFLATLITAPEPRLIAALQAIAEARRKDPLTAHVIAGVHMEGPHISPQDGARGAHPLDALRPPSIAEFERWQAASGGLVKLVTISPHYPETNTYIASLSRQGIAVSIGHTHCTADQVREAARAGASLSTHLGNGVADPLPRHPNLIWAQLADDRLTAMLIADGHHLPADTLKVMLRAKGLDRSILVSDAVALAGMPPGRYQAPIGGEVELTPEGRLGLADSCFLAGAALPLSVGITHVLRTAGLSLSQALTLTTKNPGRFVDHRGRMQVGESADLLRFQLTPDGRLDIETVMVAGEIQPH